MQTALIIIASLVIGFLLLNVYARSVMKKIPKVPDHAKKDFLLQELKSV